MQTLSRNEFSVLRAYQQRTGLSQRKLAEALDISLGAVNATVKSLATAGLVDANGVTEAGLQALEPYRVQNAVIMAAGMSSRFAPISYERPKGILRVRGEVLIERQIRQLKEAGISDIILVVGYRKEEFFYLEDALGVTIVENPVYYLRNNNSTIQVAREHLGNTYICSSDDYFTENPFEPYVYEAYYSAVYEAGPTDEYCLTTKGRERRIVGITPGGHDSWVMMGHAYWDRSYSEAFLRVLDAVYDDPRTAGKLWEDIYLEHIPELPMVMRAYDHDVIWEFDSLDELSTFDPEFIENVDSAAMDNICSVLGCARRDLANFEPISQGLTNLSVCFEVDGQRYVYRHPGAGTDEIINRAAEAHSQQVASKLGIDRTFIYEDPERGWKVSRFIPDCIEFDYHNPAHVKQAMGLIRTLHQSGESSPWTFDLNERAAAIVELLNNRSFGDFSELSAQIATLYSQVAADGVAPVLCHNDFYAPNLLIHGSSMDLIDWEYSAMSDYASDLGTFICCSDYGIAEAEAAIEAYFERTPTIEELRHCMAYVAIASYYWFVWALYKEETGDPTGPWLRQWYRGAKLFGSHAATLYE